MLDCYWKYYLGVECPGCGFQRSFLALFQGNIYESLKLFPATIPLILTILLVALHLKFKFKNGAKAITILFCSTSIIMVVSFIFKISTHGIH
jgi:hypothetical protein